GTGLSPLNASGSGAPALRFNSVYAWATEGNLYFAFKLGSNSNAPTVFDWDYTVGRGGSLNIAAPGILANAINPSGHPLSAQVTSGVQHGTLNLNPNGGFNYLNDGSNASQDLFNYRATDGTNLSNQAKVTLHIVDGVPPQIVSANNTT